MGETARALGRGPELEFEGRTYEVSPLTFELQARFETWMERRAYESVRRHRAGVPDEEYYRLLAAVARDSAAGEYSFGSKASVKAGASLPGIRQLLYLGLSKRHPEVDEDFVDRLLGAKMEEAVAVLARANADPKALMRL